MVDLSKVKKGDIVLVNFWDHSLQHRGSQKDDKVMALWVTGRLASKVGKQIKIETWWIVDKGYETNHEIALVIKSAIINIWRLEIK